MQMRRDVTNVRLIVTSPVGSLNTWVHYVVTYNGNSLPSGIKMYKDGVSQTVTTVASNLDGSIITNEDVFFGKRPSNIQYLTGLLDEYIVCGRELKDIEVKQLYNSDSGLLYVQENFKNGKISFHEYLAYYLEYLKYNS